MAVLVFGVSGRLAVGAEIWHDRQADSLSLNVSAKSSALLTHTPEDETLYPDRDAATGLFRLRLGSVYTHGSEAEIGFAYDQSIRTVNHPGATTGQLSSSTDARPPYRLRPLDWGIADNGSRFSYRHEIDRAYLSLHPEWGSLTLGRQAIGLGRGVIFNAIDLFAPFTTLEPDREWRRGVDAARLAYRLGPTASTEAIAVFGNSVDTSAFLGRVRGYAGPVDGELLAGRRCRDNFVAGSTSAVVGEAEVHFDMALFEVPETDSSGDFGNDRLRAKAVLGTSYTFNIGSGLTAVAEYHYSGFGVDNIENASKELQTPEMQQRYARGDFQILGKHAVGTELSYTFTAIYSATVLVIASPRDGSGVLSPSLLWDVSDNLSVTFSAYLPWGRPPHDGVLHSEYGGAPAGLFTQAALTF